MVRRLAIAAALGEQPELLQLLGVVAGKPPSGARQAEPERQRRRATTSAAGGRVLKIVTSAELAEIEAALDR